MEEKDSETVLIKQRFQVLRKLSHRKKIKNGKKVVMIRKTEKMVVLLMHKQGADS